MADDETLLIRLSSCGKFRISFLCTMQMLILSPVVEGSRKPRLYRIINIRNAPNLLIQCIQSSSRFVVNENTFFDIRPPRWSFTVRMFSTEYVFEDAGIIRGAYIRGPVMGEHFMDLSCVPNLQQQITRVLDQAHLYDKLTLQTEFFFIDKTNYSAGLVKRWWIRTRRIWRRKVLGAATEEALSIYALNDDCLTLILDFAFPPP
jgi:hypothetical protein